MNETPKAERHELIRLVRLTLRPEALPEFLAIFERAAPVIRQTEGCLHLELWQDERYPGLVSTFSRWTSAEHLEAYRSSPFFRETWTRTRELFAAPPWASSHYRLD